MSALPPSAVAPSPLGAGQWEEARVHRELRAVERGLRARLCSIEHDALQALHLYASLSSLPLFANARAGAWYVPPSTRAPNPPFSAPAICAFKSADGHYGKWSSSLRRPNAHVFRAAADAGGVVLVDVTRRGKAWPDSFAKTVPIWCAVVNAVAGLTRCTCSAPAVDPSACVDCTPLHLHPNVPESEREQIRARLPHWVAAWRRAGVELHRIAPAFAAAKARRVKPLRALWLRPARPVWEKGVPLAEMDFTPVICVSASVPVPEGERQFVEPRVIEEVVCGVRFPPCPVGFPYVQGAGDDEEAWCRGLTPELFWRYRDEFMDIARAPCASESAAEIEVKLRNKVEVVLSRSLPIPRNRALRTAPVGIGVPIWTSRIRLARIPRDAQAEFVSSAAAYFGSVLMLGSPRPAPESNINDPKDKETLAEQDVMWVPMTDRKGKTDFKYAFGRALGPCLSMLRGCCVDRRLEALVCCNAKNGDWSAGMAIAWLAWHCSLVSPAVTEDDERNDDPSCGKPHTCEYSVNMERKEKVGEIEKERVHAVMLHFTCAYPQFQISRATLKQLNRFFSSPTPSSTVSELQEALCTE